MHIGQASDARLSGGFGCQAGRLSSDQHANLNAGTEGSLTTPAMGDQKPRVLDFPLWIERKSVSWLVDHLRAGPISRFCRWLNGAPRGRVGSQFRCTALHHIEVANCDTAKAEI